MQTQKQRSIGSKGQETRPPPATSTNIRSSGDDQENGRSDVFMQEDDVAYWLHCPVDDNSLESCLQYNHGLPYPVSTPVTVSPTCLPPPLPELHASDKPPPAVISVGEKGRGGGGEVAGKEIEAREMSVSVTSSPGSSGSMEPPSPTDRMEYDTKFHNNEDIDFGYADVKKQSHGGSTSTKRSRSTEIHNLSERRRRDRINEKMKTLQELIPRCNKSDKASILDEAIEYLKSLQMQVQMMSTGCSMVPMMFLRPQQYMLPMAMGTNPLVFPYLAIPPGPSMPNPSAAAHLSQQFPVPGFNMTPVTVAGPVANPMMSSFTPNSQNQPQLLTFVDPFQQYHSLGQTELPLPQNQGVMPPIASKPSSFKASPNQ